ncbi:MAG: DUF192 domain-containing protein [Leptolyngbyaceae cyanobacterium SM2_5_2]|nr:DUF192 domain-containing protein [Leptolyngbyaceae cyanobacterium SM2_5_2]
MVFSTGCSTPATTALESPARESVDAAPAPRNDSTALLSQQGQQLPVTAVTTLGGQEIFLEVAATPQQQSLGLMYREALPDDRGMLFPISPARPVSFWMKNVPVPLDMVFIYQGTIRAIAASVPPCPADPCPTYGPGNQPVDQVIELRAGRAAELGLAVGDLVAVSPIQPNGE